MRVFSYLRVSGLGQVDKDGPERQRESIQLFCRKHELSLVAEFSEGGVSGETEAMDRPQFAEMLAKIDLLRAEDSTKPLAAQAIVVERMDRLARDLMVSEFLIAECRKRSIKVFCADQGELIDMVNDGGDPTRTMLRQILGAIAQWDRSVTVRKLRSARLRMRANGVPCEGKKAYGHTEREMQTLRDIDNWIAIGDSYLRIATALNERGSRTRHGLLWTDETVRSVYKRRRLKIKRKII